MYCVVQFVEQKPGGRVSRRDVEMRRDVLRLGRSAGSDIHLPDVRIPLDAAEIHQQESDVWIFAMASSGIQVNGMSGRESRLRPGDRVTVGPYEMTIAAPPPGFDFACVVELVRPLGDEFDLLRQRNRLTLAELKPGKRVLSWLAFGIALIGSLAAPLIGLMTAAPGGNSLDVSGKTIAWTSAIWSSGPISNAHAFFASACRTCHEKPFVAVRDVACLTCHQGITQHADPVASPSVVAARERCTGCHAEHNGPRQVTRNSEAFCVSCHARLDQVAPHTTLLNVSHFASDHPEFRATVAVDGMWKRLPLSGAETPRESSNLHHSHESAVHGLMHPTKGLLYPTCTDCHAPVPGGPGFRPISYESHCGQCHRHIDVPSGHLVLPHAEPQFVRAVLSDYAMRLVLSETAAADDIDPMTLVHRIDATTDRLMQTQVKAFCSLCHEMSSDKARRELFIAPVLLADRWLPKAEFDHRKHRTTPCNDCHLATQSATAQDVLIPGIATCRRCHGGEGTVAKVPSTCVDCHKFHIPGRPLMTETGHPRFVSR